jgi:hypothetical protein
MGATDSRGDNAPLQRLADAVGTTQPHAGMTPLGCVSRPDEFLLVAGIQNPVGASASKCTTNRRGIVRQWLGNACGTALSKSLARRSCQTIRDGVTPRPAGVGARRLPALV